MALKDIYGIGKGSAQVVDLRPINAMVQSREEANIKRNEARAKQRSTMAAAINSQRDKLKNTAWREDRVYIDGLINDTKKWMSDTYVKHGEMALVDNPELKREWQEKIDFITQQNDTSAANIAMGDKMLIRSQENLDTIDAESGIAFNKWMDLPPEERLKTPIPMIKDRKITGYESLVEAGADGWIENLIIEKEYTGGKNKETGAYTDYELSIITDQDMESLAERINTSTDSVPFKTYDRTAFNIIDNTLYPEFITVEGEKIPNPKRQDEQNRIRKELIKRDLEKFRKKDKKTSKTHYGAVKQEEVEPSGFRTSTGLRSGYFKTKNGEGFTLSDEKKNLIPIEVTTIINGKEQVVKVLPSEFVKNIKGKWFIKGAAYRDTWEELTKEQQEEYGTEDKYILDVTKSENINIPVTSNVKAKIESQYGVSNLNTHLKNIKEGEKTEESDKSTQNSSTGGAY